MIGREGPDSVIGQPRKRLGPRFLWGTETEEELLAIKGVIASFSPSTSFRRSHAYIGPPASSANLVTSFPAPRQPSIECLPNDHLPVAMAIHPTLHTSSAAQGSLTPQQAVEISAWSERATESLTISSSPVPYGDPIPLRIPLDDDSHRADSQSPLRLRNARVAARADATPVISSTYRRRDQIGRDSLKRRETLMKGKEGSRRRQRWENGTSCTYKCVLIDARASTFRCICIVIGSSCIMLLYF